MDETESATPVGESALDSVASWLRSIHKNKANWEAMGSRLTVTAASMRLEEGSFTWLAKRLSEGSPGSPSFEQVSSLLSMLVHEDVRADFKSIAPELADDIELWSYRLSAVVGPMHDLFGQGRDWLRVNVEYLHSLAGGVLPYRAQLVTYMRNGESLVIETTPSGLAKYARILIDELIDIPSDAENDLDVDEVHGLAESGQRLQAKFDTRQRPRTQH